MSSSLSILPSHSPTLPVRCRGSSAHADDLRRTPLPAESAYPTVAGYEIIQLLGRGGMGVVFLARETVLDRPVALKIVAGGAFADPEVFGRFQREAEATARLQHPNIVQIFRVGATDGGAGVSPYLALEYVAGSTLAAQIGKPVPPRTSAGIVATLASAIQYAHDRGIVHRDLKPGNVLLQRTEDREQRTEDKGGIAAESMRGTTELRPPSVLCLLSSVPKITDFGLAKRLDPGGAGHPATSAGSMLGTPEYMAPEQASGACEIGPAADIYALGVILFELLTGRVPFQGADAIDTLLQVRDREPPPISRLRPGLPRDLQTICGRCLEKDPDRRYPSAAALAADLHAWLDGRPIAARRVTAAERTWKWARRRPAAAALVLAIFALLVGGIAGVVWQWRQAEARVVAERQAHDRVDAALAAAETNLYFSRVNVAQRELSAGNLSDAVRHLDACRPRAGEPDRRGWEWHYLINACRTEQVAIRASTEWVWDVAFSPDGRLLATAVGTPYLPAARSESGELALWDATTGHLVRKFAGTGGTVRRVSFSPDGLRLAASSYDGWIRQWEIATGEPLGVPLPCEVRDPGGADFFGEAGPFWYSPDGRSLVVRRTAGWFEHPLAGGPDEHLPHLEGTIGHSPDRRLAAIRREGQDLSIVRVSDGGRHAAVPRLGFGHYAAIAPDGQAVVVSVGEHVEQYETGSGQRLRMLSGPTGWVEVVAYSRDGLRFAAAGADRRVYVWRRDTPFCVAYAGHEAEVRALEFSPDGQRLASCDRAGRVMIWDVRHHPQGQYFAAARHSSVVSAVGLSAEGDAVMTADFYGGLRRFDMTGRVSGYIEPDGLTRQVRFPRGDVEFSREGDSLFGATEAARNVVRQWCSRTGTVRQEFRGHQTPVQSVAVSADGRRLATRGTAARADKSAWVEIFVWDIATGRAVHEIPPEPVVGLALTSDGGRLAGVNRRGEALVWDVRTGRPLWKRPAHGNEAELAERRVMTFAVAFSPDDRVLATGGFEDGLVKLWDAATGEPLVPPLPMRPTITGVTFTPDSRRVAAAGYDGETRLWDVVTGQLALALPAPSGPRRGDTAFTARPVFSLRNGRLALIDARGFLGCWDGRAAE